MRHDRPYRLLIEWGLLALLLVLLVPVELLCAEAAFETLGMIDSGFYWMLTIVGNGAVLFIATRNRVAAAAFAILLGLGIIPYQVILMDRLSRVQVEAAGALAFPRPISRGIHHRNEDEPAFRRAQLFFEQLLHRMDTSDLVAVNPRLDDGRRTRFGGVEHVNDNGGSKKRDTCSQWHRCERTTPARPRKVQPTRPLGFGADARLASAEVDTQHNRKERSDHRDHRLCQQCRRGRRRVRAPAGPESDGVETDGHDRDRAAIHDRQSDERLLTCVGQNESRERLAEHEGDDQHGGAGDCDDRQDGGP